MRKCKKNKKVKKTVCFSNEKLFAFIFKDYFFQNPYVLSVFCKGQLRSAAGPRRCCFTLCVCFCVVPSLNRNENPYRSAISVREKPMQKTIKKYTNSFSKSLIKICILCPPPYGRPGDTRKGHSVRLPVPLPHTPR